jgi:Flp pilus assembly protein TadG
MKMLQRRFAGNRRPRGEEGQSLLETAFAMPLLLGLAFNVINLGYFWYMVLTISAAPRMGAQYATQGGQAIQTVTAPGTTAVSNLVYDNMTNAVVGATTSNVSVQVCTSAKGVNSTTHITLCDQFGPAFSYSATATDPEAPYFVLDRVDVAYQVTPVIPGSAFNVVLPASLVFHRQVSMRSLF